MKYKTGDKFVIEIESRINSQGLYKIKNFDALVFDDKGLDRLEQIYKHDGCDGCRYEHLTGEQEPCESCLWNCTSKFEPKPEEIQVGDEVEHDDGRKGVVVKITDTEIYAIYRDNDTIMRCYWFRELCHRTGKTYPELIKALEQLPKGVE